MAKQAFAKTTPSFWKSRIFRPVFTRGGKHHEVSQWYARIQHSGRRESVGLGENDQEKASRVAAKLYKNVCAMGWTAALADFRPTDAPRCLTTVGDWINAVRPVLSVRQVTFSNYAFALRRIAAGIVGISDNGKLKFNPKRLEWRAKVDAVRLSEVTPKAVKKWRRAFVTAVEGNPLLQQRAKNSANSYLRNARALFGREVLAELKGESLPDPMPFDGVKVEDSGNTKYVSVIDATGLLRGARKDLAKTEPDAWKVVLLALGAGLRRGEIDGLCRTQVDFDKGVVRILTSEHFEAKTEDSVGEVYVDPGLLTELKALLPTTALFVVEPDTPTRPHRRGQFYRCEETFAKVTAWLRKKGVLTLKPLHTLRKEFGSIINAQADIHTASRQLRHSTISTTAKFYADNRKRVTVGIGEMLKEAK